ncbi:DNA polymerase III epsilon subunit-like protein [Bradyrhizobium japonicum]
MAWESSAGIDPEPRVAAEGFAAAAATFIDKLTTPIGPPQSDPITPTSPEKTANHAILRYLVACVPGIVRHAGLSGPPQPFREVMFQAATDLAAMAEALGRSGDYRILRRLVARPTYSPTIGQEVRTGVLLDTETTGLDHAKDEIIELGMVKFDYTPDGRIVGVRDTFSAFNEPSGPISAEVTALTGITDEMVAGHRFDDAAVTAFVGDAVIVIAHNSGFDRKFAERYWPLFEHKAWGCSMSEIDWRKHGFAGAQLGYLLNGAGFFHQAQRAVDDCHALLEVLAFELPTTGSPALALLLETARKATLRVWAEQTAFELKDSLKRRGYRWNDGSDGRPKSWFIDVDETALDDEIAFLRTEIYTRDVEPGVQRLAAKKFFTSWTFSSVLIVSLRFRSARIQMAEKPPSTDNSNPFTKLESSEARNSAAAAISSGRPIFPRGIRDSNICFASSVRTWSCIGVAIGPGCITFTRIFLPLSSLSHPRANACSAALLAAYTL